MTSQTATTRYAVVSVSAADRRPDGPIYGIGATEATAMNDAAEWVENPDGVDVFEVSPELGDVIDATARRGGDVANVRYEYDGRAQVLRPVEA